ncbi:MAG: RHS repeat protein [Verrucomicrobia bacterium]|nr:RHS repeat protein [Verrucomicrobiota bacterium]
MRLLALCFLSAFSLFADPKLAVTEGDPASLIEGCVSAITGDLYFAQDDVVVEGYVPLRLPRYYVSGDGKEEGWSFFNHLEATYRGGDVQHSITIYDTNGSSFIFDTPAEEVFSKYRKQHKKRKPSKHQIKFRPQAGQLLGVTNTSHRSIGGHTNLKNARLYLEVNAETLVFQCCDQTIRSYKVHHKKKHFKDIFKDEECKRLKFLLESELLPTGNKVVYNYDHEDRLTSIRTTSPNGAKTYASATFHYHHKHKDSSPDVDIHTSDGRVLRYRYENKHGRFLLSSVASPEVPEESIMYHPTASWGGILLSRRSLPDLRYCDAEYYTIGEHKTQGFDVKIKDRHDPRFLRVKMLKAPVGTDIHGHPTSRMYYNIEQRYTDVRAIDFTLMRYRYSEEQLLTSIERFGHNDSYFNAEVFEWSPMGDLLGHTFYIAPNQPVRSKKLAYDERGNVTRETHLIGQEGSYTTQRQYDALNNLVREEEQNGKTTLYSYLPGTSLVTSQLTCFGERIISRCFYVYNGDRVLTHEIVDNGTTGDGGNLTGVTVRNIKAISPMTEGPYVDMPHVIEEKIWDGTKEVTLKTRVLSYTTGAKVAQEDVYDAKGSYRFSLKYSYDHLGRVVERWDPLGQMEKYVYDSTGNLAQVQKARSTLFMSYDCSNRLIQSKEVGDDGIERVTTHTYDGKHHKTDTTDPYGHTTSYHHDPYGQVLETLAHGQVERASYDGAGRAISRTSSRGYVTTSEYNARNQVTKVSHPDGTSEKWLYNLDGTLRAYIDQEGGKTEYLYDPFGRKVGSIDPLSRKETYTYDGMNLLSKVDAAGYTTWYTYDAAGRKIAEERAGEKTVFSYDALGRVDSVTRGDLRIVTEYDLLDRAIEEREEDLEGNVYSKVVYVYDAAGDRCSILREVMGQKAKEEFVYDSLHRLTLHRDPLGAATKTLYNDHFVNEQGQRVLQKTTIDPMGLKTVETLDPKGRLVSLEKRSGKDETLALEVFMYDAEDHLLSQTSTLYPQGTQVTTLWEYDSMGRVVAQTEAAGTAYPKCTRTSYTPKGQVLQIIKPDGVILAHQYDKVGNLISLSASDHSVDYLYRYNQLNELIEVVDQLSRATTIRSYDAFGRLVKEKLSTDLVLQSTYDGQGRRTSLELPDKSSISYRYAGPHLKEVSRSGYKHTYHAYDLSGNLLSEELLTGDILSGEFDLAGHKNKTSSRFYSQEVLKRDLVYNPLLIETQKNQAEYAYDALYQVVCEKASGCSHRYTYDSHHNRLGKDDHEEKFNALNQLEGVGYDQNGNPICLGSTYFHYDALDRLIAVEEPHQRLEYSYDAFHRRISKTIHTSQGKEQYLFLYDGENEIGAIDERGHCVQLRILGYAPHAEIGAAVALELNGKLYVPLHDLQGNSVMLLSPEGKVLSTTSYDIFGGALTPLHAENPWGFASKRHDETGLIYFGRRYYDPKLGRWLTPDPLGLDAGVNLYAFVMNNPLIHFDLYGLTVEGDPNWVGQRMCIDTPMIGQSMYINTPMIGQSCPVKTSMINPTPIEVESIPRPVMTQPSTFANVARDAFSSPRFHGTLRALGGLVEVGAAGKLMLASGGIGVPLLWPVMAHGFDHFITGIDMVVSGKTRETVTSQLLQMAGVSREQSIFWDDTASCLANIVCGGLIYRGMQAGSPLYYSPKNLGHNRGLISEQIICKQKGGGLEIDRIEKQISGWLGEDTHMIRNRAGDPVFLSKDGCRRFRFDFNNPHGDKVHLHIEKKAGGRWEDASANHRIYPFNE